MISGGASSNAAESAFDRLMSGENKPNAALGDGNVTSLHMMTPMEKEDVLAHGFSSGDIAILTWFMHTTRVPAYNSSEFRYGVDPSSVRKLYAGLQAAAVSVARGTRLTVVVPREDHGEWERRALAAGLFELPADAIGISHLGASETVPWGADGLERRTLEGGYRIFIGGTARYASSKITLDHDVAEPFMDPRDRGIGCEAPERKTERSYQPIPHDPARWLGKGFSPFVDVQYEDQDMLLA